MLYHATLTFAPSTLFANNQFFQCIANGYVHFQSICDIVRNNNLKIIDTIMNIIKGNTIIFNFIK